MKRTGMVFGAVLILASLAAEGQAAPRPPRNPGVTVISQTPDSVRVVASWQASTPAASVAGYALRARGGALTRTDSTTARADTLWLPRAASDVAWNVCVWAYGPRGPSAEACASVTVPAVVQPPPTTPGGLTVQLLDSTVVPDTIVPPDTLPPPAGSSPHWSHARFAAFDYRIHYLQEPQRSAEYDTMAARYDLVVGGKASEWKARNPTLRQFVYDLLIGDEQADVPGMESWLIQNGHPVEPVYLHVNGARVSYHQWTADYFGLNVGDAGFKAWRAQRTAGLLAGGYDGIFWDVLGPSGIAVIPNVTDEYPVRTNYLGQFYNALTDAATAAPSGRCLANTATYTTTEAATEADRCHGTLMEFANDIYSEGGYTMWPYVAARLAAGTLVVLVPQRPGTLKNTPRYDMNPGNYGSVAERVLMAEYANYLMMVDPAKMDLLTVDFYLTGSTQPAQSMSIAWLKAFQVDIGQATAGRRVLTSGTDGAGQPYQVYARDFAHAMVVYRPMQNWARTQFGNQTMMTVSLPAGVWRVLQANGSTGPAMTSIGLRNGEAAIFMRG